MEKLTPVIITAILTPVAATIVGLFATRLGITKKIKDIEYRLKRAELIEKIIALKPELDSEIDKKIDWKFIEEELKSIVDHISMTKDEPKKYIEYKYESRPFLLRLFLIPKPRTFPGWFGAIFFYIYLTYSIAAAVAWLLGVNFMFNEDDPYFMAYMVVAMFLFSLLCKTITTSSSKLVFLEEKISILANHKSS